MTKDKETGCEQGQHDQMDEAIPMDDLLYSFVQYPASQVKGSNEPDENSEKPHDGRLNR